MTDNCRYGTSCPPAGDRGARCRRPGRRRRGARPQGAFQCPGPRAPGAPTWATGPPFPPGARSTATPPAPAAPDTVAAHLAAFAGTASASTLKVRRAAIGAAHRAAGLGDPAGSELVKRALAGLARERAAPQRQAKALGLAELAAVRATACQPRSSRQSGRTESKERARERGLADIALCSLLFYAGLRRSEAAELAWGDVEEAEDGSGLLWVRRSKTDPAAEGSARYLPRGRRARARGDPPGGRAGGGSRVRARRPADREARRGGRGRRRAGGGGFPGTPGAWAWPPSSAAPAPPPTRSPRAGGWKSAGMVIRYTRREIAKRGAVARYLEGRQDPPG